MSTIRPCVRFACVRLARMGFSYYLAFNQLFEFFNYSKFDRLLDYYGNDIEKAWGNRFEWPLEDFGFKLESLPKIKKIIKDYDALSYEARLKRAKISFSTIEDQEYPEALKKVSNPPLVLYFVGDGGVLKQLSIAVVGTRLITAYGKRVVEQFVPVFCHHSLAVISGMAFGVDAYAHKIALESGGTTVAVLPSSLDIITPSSNTFLFEKIIKSGKGLVVSEFPLQTSAMRWFFPLRSRIIVGLSQGVLVVEAGEKSGTQYAAVQALEQKKPLFAVPGPIDSDASLGTNKMLGEGAVVAYSPVDILKKMGFGVSHKGVASKVSLENLTANELKVWESLKLSPLDFGDLAKICDLETSDLNIALTSLEIKGMVRGEGAVYSVIGGIS